jgi:hypothetical protein
MSWLHQIISTLDTVELNRVRQMKLRGKEKAMLDLMLRYRELMPPDVDQVCGKILVAKSHFYKINSVLIDKVVDAIEGVSPLSRIRLFNRKFLFNLLKSEILQVVKRKDLFDFSEKEQAEFWLECFRILIDLPYKYYDDGLVNQVVKCYLGVEKEKPEESQNYIAMHRLFCDCNRYAASRNPEKLFQYNKTDLLSMEEDLLPKNHPLSLYYLYRTFVSYFTYYKKDVRMQLVYIQKAIALKDKIKASFFIDLDMFLSLLLADILFSNRRISEAFEQYRVQFNTGIPKEMYGYFYHCEQYALICMLEQKLDMAQLVLDRNFTLALHRKDDEYATKRSLSYAKLAICTGDYKECLHQLALAREINEKACYLPFELQIRFLECVAFFLKQDFEHTRQLIYRNQKFLLTLAKRTPYADYVYFFKFMNQLVAMVESKSHLPPSFEKDFIELHDVFVDVFGPVVRLLRKSVR